MWRDHKLAIIGGVATLSVLGLVVRRLVRNSQAAIFVVQDRSLLTGVGRLEGVAGPVEVIERVYGKQGGLPSLSPGQFDVGKVMSAEGSGVAKYAGNLLYIHETTSTSSVMQACFSDVCHNLLVTCDEQTAGRGRTGPWVSRLGCLMFTYKFTCEIRYALPVQTLIPLAMVLAITKELSKIQGESYSQDYVRVKWPNDIYLGKAKIGGVLVDSETRGALITMNIGIGVNVDNEHPTTCLNSIAKGHCTRESLLIQYLNAFDDLIVKLKTEGVTELQQMYEERWYHRGTKAVFLPTGETVTLIGVNLNAGVVVQTQTGDEKVVQTREELKLEP